VTAPRAGRAPGARRGGFSVTELVVVGMMTTLLSMILATVWSGFCRPARDAATRCRLATEANLACYALAEDLGGDLAGVRIVPDTSPTALPGRVGLQLSYNGPAAATVTYRLDGRRLIRTGSAGADVTLAAELVPFSPRGTGFDLSPWSDGAGNSGVLIGLTFASAEKNGRYRGPDGLGGLVPRVLTLHYQVVAVAPAGS